MRKLSGSIHDGLQEADSGVVVTPAGAAFRVIKQGSGSRPSAKSLVRVHYEGRTVDGLVFDSSRGPGQGHEQTQLRFHLTESSHVGLTLYLD